MTGIEAQHTQPSSEDLDEQIARALHLPVLKILYNMMLYVPVLSTDTLLAVTSSGTGMVLQLWRDHHVLSRLLAYMKRHQEAVASQRPKIAVKPVCLNLSLHAPMVLAVYIEYKWFYLLSYANHNIFFFTEFGTSRIFNVAGCASNGGKCRSASVASFRPHIDFNCCGQVGQW